MQHKFRIAFTFAPIQVFSCHTSDRTVGKANLYYESYS